MNTTKLLEDLHTKPEKYWLKRGQRKALKLFHLMAKRVPAYQDFLKNHNIIPQSISSIEDFKKIPLIDKDIYLRKYLLEKLCWDENLAEKRWTIAATSGSTGEPFYFPRQKEQDLQYAMTAELYLRTNFEIHKKTTLYINGFGMGIWIGGVFTYQAIKYLADRGNYSLSIITPGSSKEEIIKAVKNLGKKFDQIIIGGYPPLIKDMLDDGIKFGLIWKKYSLGFIFSAEGFSENFRDYIIEKAGLKNKYKDTLNHYGTVDLGTMAHETPICILIRRLIIKHNLNKHFFKKDYKLPTLAQFIPELFYFEEINSQIVCSAFSGLPLVRYDLKDSGGIIRFEKMTQTFSKLGIDLIKEIKNENIDKTTWNLPFVYVFERSDFTVKLSGANIYAEEIKKALYSKELVDFLTGKFTMSIKFDDKQNQYLEINIELKLDIDETKELKKIVVDIVIQQLRKENSEYQYLYVHLPHERLTPQIIFWQYGHPEYFITGGKQKWIKK